MAAWEEVNQLLDIYDASGIEVIGLDDALFPDGWDPAFGNRGSERL